MTNILYHYTAREYLDRIKAEGLTKGEVPISSTFCLNAVWLTTDPTATGHGLSNARPLTPQEKRLVGIPLDAPARFANKRAVRIAVDVEGLDVIDWLPWARPRIAPDWLGTLHRAGGGMKKAKTWRLYFGTIPPDRFAGIDILKPA